MQCLAFTGVRYPEAALTTPPAGGAGWLVEGTDDVLAAVADDDGDATYLMAFEPGSSLPLDFDWPGGSAAIAARGRLSTARVA